jgi:hypothetical protein
MQADRLRTGTQQDVSYPDRAVIPEGVPWASTTTSRNVPITAVSKILGHANPAITMGIYAHELQEDLDQVRVAMGKFG